MRKHVLMLSAGFGGLELATRLSETMSDAVRVTLLDRNDAFFFGRARAVVALAVVTLALAPAPAAADRVIEAQCCGGATVSSYGGWIAWSRGDPATGRYALVVRSPSGQVTQPAVAERSAPFDVQLGPSASGSVAAVYSRCSAVAALRGCSLFELRLPGAGETRLDPPGGGSLHEPAIWRGEIVYLRRARLADSEDPARPGATPDALYFWRVGSAAAHRVSLASSRGARENGIAWPRGLTGVITGLTLRGSLVSYVTHTASGPFALATLWVEVLGQRPRFIDQVTAGAGNVCMPDFVSPALDGASVAAYLHACATSGDGDRWTRYSLTKRTAEDAAQRLTRYSDEPVFAVVRYGRGAIFNDGDLLELESITWRAVRRPQPESFCSHDDLIC